MTNTRAERETELGQLAYRAHNRVTGCEDQMPAWADLHPRIQTAWEIAAAAVKRSVQREGR